jgi:glycosyltransferase involved in cell wall biosynthesis
MPASRARPVPEEDELDVSIVLPVYNERGHIGTEVDRITEAMDRSPYSYEIIVVDDGSDDGSEDELATLRGVRLLRFAENRGAGSARKFGTRAARGTVVVWTDVDMTYPNHLIPELVAELAGADQVVGARSSEQGTHRIARVPAKWFIRKLASYLVQQKIPDLNSGLRAFRRDVALQYVSQLPPGFSCVTTLTLSFMSNGYTVRYWPIDYQPRAGSSKFHWFRDTRRYLLQVVRMIVAYNPLRIFLPIGLLLLVLGAGKLVYDVWDADFKVAANTLLLVFAAFQVLLIGMLADLIGRSARPADEVQPASAEWRVGMRAVDSRAS